MRFVLSFFLTFLLLSVLAAHAADPVAEAFAAVRNNNNAQFLRQSSVLGTLPDPAELAAAQPNLCRMFTARYPLDIKLTPQRIEQVVRDYRYYSFNGPPRSLGPVSLGLTGAFIRTVKGRSELVVIDVLPGTPAEGVLQVDDVILGANGRIFHDTLDPRRAMGVALYESTTAKLEGKLHLYIARQGKATNVIMTLPIMPAYSATWPYDCERAKRIADTLLKFVMERGPGGRNFWGALFLMASGDQAALTRARSLIYRGLKDEYESHPADGPIYSSWRCGYGLVTLAEYYLLTGDSSVLPKMRYQARLLQNGQSGAGGWGHSCPCRGYGEVNATGAVDLMGLALAREAGIELLPDKLAKSIRYFGRFINTGMPYGNHGCGFQSPGSNNGKASSGVLAFKFFGEDQVARTWGRGSAYMYGSPEGGHAEGIFNLAWDPLAANLAPPAERQVYFNNLLWYYELARTHEGGLRFFRGGHFNYRSGATTCALGLAYLLPRKKIYLTGAPKSVFAMTAPDDALARCARYFKEKKWAPLKKELDAYLKAHPQNRYARLLREAYERMQANVELTIRLAEQNLRDHRWYRARRQLQGLERLLGGPQPRITALLAKTPLKAPRQSVPPLAPVESKATCFAYDPIAPPTYDWEFILPWAEESKERLNETYRVYCPDDPAHGPSGSWFDADYQPKNWIKHKGQIVTTESRVIWLRRKFKLMANPRAYQYLKLEARNCSGQLYLNGYKVVDFGQGETYLRAGAARVLKNGTNTMAVRLDQARGKVDLALQAGPPILPDMKDLLDDI